MMSLSDTFAFTIADSDNGTTRRLKAFRGKYCSRMEFEDKENKNGTRYVKGVFKLRQARTTQEVRTLMGQSRLYLKAKAYPTSTCVPTSITVPEVGEDNPLTVWWKTRPSLTSVLGSTLRSVMKWS